MITELKPGDHVRVKPLAAIGLVIQVSMRMRHSPYLVQIVGYGTRGYGATDLEKLPPGMAMTLPPRGSLS
jgi:hypothetical protein